ncbi:hypothetical protein GUJ93_ZPchr0012g19580 [Zizania palustris]|uniref:Uncharacterized protein n=1 Tax=Zizania palustris TaxID=103762 RepID=A0A8J5WTT2_ZIZPA|nr:hypothetical protein GUJ93_ZPchr0012g19580 [Zizania palustris]
MPPPLLVDYDTPSSPMPTATPLLSSPTVMPSSCLSHQCGVLMGRPKQAWKRDNFKRFRRNTRAERRANVTSSDSSDDSTSSSMAAKEGITISLFIQDHLDEKLDALVEKVEGFTSTNTQRRMSLADQPDLVNKKLDALIAKVDGLTMRNTQRRVSLANQLDIVNKKLDVVIKTVGTK